MSPSKMSLSLFVRAIIALSLLAGIGLGAWLLSTPSLNAASRLAPLTLASPIGSPQLGLNKSVDNSAPAPGAQINYTLSYSNTQPGSQAFNVQLYDFLPAGAQFISSNPPAAVYPNGVLLFTTPALSSGVVNTVTVQVRVPAGHTQMTNHALVVADSVTPTVTSLLTNIVQTPTNWLRLVKSGPSAALINGVLVYTLQATNLGGSPLQDVTVVDILPAGVSLTSAAPAPGSVTLPLVSWSLGSLAPAASRTIVITATAPGVTGIVTNSAVASAWQNVITQTLFSTQVTNNAAILNVTKTGSAPVVRVGATLVYTLAYKNVGNQAATTVRLTDTLPSGLTVIGASPLPTSQTAQRLAWSLDTLAAGQQGQIVITTTVGAPWGRTLLNAADVMGQPGSYAGHAELSTNVPLFKLDLPIVVKNAAF
jgi:large repetitive protein